MWRSKAPNLASFPTERQASSKPLAFGKCDSKSRPSADRGYILLSKGARQLSDPKLAPGRPGRRWLEIRATLGANLHHLPFGTDDCIQPKRLACPSPKDADIAELQAV
jgi:hypothetical protein